MECFAPPQEAAVLQDCMQQLLDLVAGVEMAVREFVAAAVLDAHGLPVPPHAQP